MTRRGPSRRRLSGSLRRRQGSALRAAPFGANGLDRASREPNAGSYVMARLSDRVESCATSADSASSAGVNGMAISISRCRELLGQEAESMTDREVAMFREHAESMASILIDMYKDQRRTTE